ncbi:MAG: BLUF domain-containing protein [Steroidobacteraceae bacterium]|nr:BLUF domain-containing protein [Steroidobacteraceae bacterium]
MLVRLLYASRAATPLIASVQDSIMEQSRAHNPEMGITGVLCFSDDLFIQVLEGGRDAVCELYNTIVRDDRHQNVRILSFEEIRERRFGSWTMGQVNLAKVNPALLLKYGERAELNPFIGSGQASMALLDELIATALVASRST